MERLLLALIWRRRLLRHFNSKKMRSCRLQHRLWAQWTYSHPRRWSNRTENRGQKTVLPSDGSTTRKKKTGSSEPSASDTRPRLGPSVVSLGDLPDQTEIDCSLSCITQLDEKSELPPFKLELPRGRS